MDMFEMSAVCLFISLNKTLMFCTWFSDHIMIDTAVKVFSHRLKWVHTYFSRPFYLFKYANTKDCVIAKVKFKHTRAHTYTKDHYHLVIFNTWSWLNKMFASRFPLKYKTSFFATKTSAVLSVLSFCGLIWNVASEFCFIGCGVRNAM